MTSYFKPTSGQEQKEQSPLEEQGLLRRHMTPAGEKARQEQASQLFSNAQIPQPGNPPASTAFDHLPTGMLPAASTQSNRQRPMPANQMPTPQASNLRSDRPGQIQNPPSNGTGLQFQEQSLIRTQQTQPQIEGNNIILHRSPNFVVRTTNRIGQRVNPLRKPSGHTTVMPKVMPNQNQRIAASETSILPSIAPINPIKERRFPVPAWMEAIIIVIGLMVSFTAHAFNMFNFPRYELDEGTYMSNAWAILHGMIQPYA